MSTKKHVRRKRKRKRTDNNNETDPSQKRRKLTTKNKKRKKQEIHSSPITNDILREIQPYFDRSKPAKKKKKKIINTYQVTPNKQDSDSENENQTNLMIQNSDNILHVKTFEYESDFDQNGFIYYLGTHANTCNVFANPATNGSISISSSNLATNSQCAEYILERKAVRLITKAKKNTWFIIDFRALKYKILATQYTLRHYSSSKYQALRNWYFSGSNDGQIWDILRKHNNDTSLDDRGATCTWDIQTSKYYSMFKIQQVGKNSGDTYHLACSGFEIYGTARKMQVKSDNLSDSECDSEIEILPSKSSEEESTINAQKVSKKMAMDNNYNNEMSITTNMSAEQQLCDMGFDEYMISESLKYVENDVVAMMDWINAHEMTENESHNLKIVKICDIIKCERYQTLYALKQCNYNTQETLNILVNANLNTSFIVNPEKNNNNNNNNASNDNNNNDNNNIFNKLTADEISNLKLEDQILSATLLSINEERKKQQKFKQIKPIISSELRSMGFLQIAVQQALNHKSVADKKSAIRYILSHPLDNIQEQNAKIQEIINSGYSKNDAQNALNKYSQNLNMAISWLMQGKPMKIKHFLYHVSSKHVMQISVEENNQTSVELSENVNFKNMNQQWSLYDNGKIKNFANNKILAVQCKKEWKTKDLIVSYDLSLIFDSDCDVKNNELEIENKDIDENLCVFKYWDINEDDKTIKNRDCELYLVFRCDLNRFYLEKKIHIGDMEQRWCFINENELTKINPKELHQLLDSQDFECIICWENEPNIRLEPCGHATYCKTCIDELKPSQCPTCRTKIHSKQEFEAS